MFRFALRASLAFALAILPAAPVLPADDATEKSPARKTASVALAANLEPFDLTYVPHPISKIQAITAIRPAAIFAHPAFRKQIGPANDTFLELSKYLTGAEASGPGIEAIDSLILCGQVETGPNKDPATMKEKPSQFMVGGRGFVIRTTTSYDWAATVKKWMPCSRAVYRGRRYLTTPLTGSPFFQMLFERLPAGDQKEAQAARMAFFIPDDRTLVVENEERIKELIDRLASGKKEPPPPGWEKVNRGILALAIDNHDKRWARSFFPSPPGPYVPFPGWKLFSNANYITIGLEAGPVSRFTMVAVCPQQLAAREARRANKYVRSFFADACAPHTKKKSDPEAEALSKVMDALLLEGNCKPTPLGFEYVGEVRENLLRWLAPVMDRGDHAHRRSAKEFQHKRYDVQGTSSMKN